MQLLEARDLSKRYGAVRALQSVDLEVAAGEIHALLGANGAGKSTLVKILTGVVGSDQGSVSVRGEPRRISSPSAARRSGIVSVFQDSALVPDLTVRQNFRLTDTAVSAVEEWLGRLGMQADLSEQVGQLPLATIRMLDLAAALARDPQILLLDELTAALPADLAERVFDVARGYRDKGGSVLFITHRLAEVVALCDRATVLRDGRNVTTLVPADVGEEKIVEAMLGEQAPGAAGVEQGKSASAASSASGSAGTAPPDTAAESRSSSAAGADAAAPGSTAGPVTLEVSELKVGRKLDGVSFSLRRGEVLGIAALEGQGQELLFECLSGQRRPSSGRIAVDGRRVNTRSPFRAIAAGLVLVPGNRLEALLPKRSVRENIAAPGFRRLRRWGPINLRRERRNVQEAVSRLSIDARAQGEVRRLSGGNQQKVTLARWLGSGFTVMLCFDPTRGIDVGTKRQIYDLLRELANDGRAVLLFTSELAEIPLACDRCVVVYQGRVVTEMPASQATEDELLRAAHGIVETDRAPQEPSTGELQR
jgi:ribose transport system ATP-binding protein